MAIYFHVLPTRESSENEIYCIQKTLIVFWKNTKYDVNIIKQCDINDLTKYDLANRKLLWASFLNTFRSFALLTFGLPFREIPFR